MAAPRLLAQNLSKKITIEAHNQPLGEVIKQISEKGDILFSYNPQSLPLDTEITVTARNEPLSMIFEKVFTANGIEFSVSEKQVILKPGKRLPQAKPTQQTSVIKKYTLSGYVRDKTTGEAIIGANVYDQATLQGSTTNSFGFYSLSLPQGEYTIASSYVGYNTDLLYVTLNNNSERTVELELATININTVVITADEDEQKLQAGQTGQTRFSPSELKQIPGFAGNVDVIKSLQNLPGVISFGDGSAFYFVRGGNSDQNLLLIDDAPIYNPSHMFGFFSALAPDAIKEVMVYKGDFPANYGGKLSSVIDIRSRDGNMKQMGFAGNIGLYTTDLTIEGPIAKEKSSFLVSARKSNLNWLTNSVSNERVYDFSFYDFNAKLNVLLNKNNRLFFTMFNGRDIFDRYNTQSSNTFGIKWQNTTATLRWNHVFNSRLFSNTTASVSRYRYYLYFVKELDNYWNSSIADATLKTDFSWYLNPGSTLKAGIELSANKTNPGNMHYSDTETSSQLPDISTYQSTQASIYVSGDQKLGQKISTRYGLRFTRWNDLGPTTVYFFNAEHSVIDTTVVDKNTIYKSFMNFEPRVTFIYAFSENALLQANYSHTVQYMQVLSNSTSPFTSLEVWAPAGPNIKPQQADMVSLGYFKKLNRKHLEFSIETFYRKLHNQIDYKDHANMLLNPLLEGELRFGEGQAYGIETMLRRNKGKLTGWISYSYSRSLKQTEGLNNGNIYAAACDRPHNLFITLSYAPFRHWNFSTHWMYLTGSPFTSPTGFYYMNGYSVPVYGEKHNDRFPDYHRLDVSVSFLLSKPEKRFQQHLVLTIYNAYGRHNPFVQNFNKIMDDQGNFVVPTDLEGNIERIPTSISVAGAIPSLNYIFRF